MRGIASTACAAGARAGRGDGVSNRPRQARGNPGTRTAGRPSTRSSRSVLFPGKPVDAPAVACIAMVALVELALEAVEDVHHLVEARALERLAGLDGAVAAAADEHDRALL